MKNMINFFGVIALVAVIGFSMAACDLPDGGGNVDSNVAVTEIRPCMEAG